MEQALADIKAAGCNALCVYLGNFGPEISEHFLLNTSKDRRCSVQQLKKHRRPDPGTWRCILRYVKCKLQLKTSQCRCLHSGISGWRCRGLRRYDSRLFTDCKSSRRTCKLKIISFGPRPMNFLACNAPIQQLYNLGVEIEENSELDLFRHSTTTQEISVFRRLLRYESRTR